MSSTASRSPASLATLLRRRNVGRRPAARRGFTLAELILAGVIGSMIIGTISVSVGQMGRARNVSKARLEAFLRADTALAAVRRDVATIIRADDLFYTRLLLTDGGTDDVPSDGILIYSTRLAVSRADSRFESDGQEWEVQYRVEDDDLGPALWTRRDAVVDEWELGGGTAEPVVDGIESMSILAWDGDRWFESWDSDLQGLPWAIRIEVTSVGPTARGDDRDPPRATLRTTVAIDRVAPPRDVFDAIEEELDEIEAAEAAAAGGGGGAGGGLGANGDGAGGFGGGGLGGGGLDGGGGLGGAGVPGAGGAAGGPNGGPRGGGAANGPRTPQGGNGDPNQGTGTNAPRPPATPPNQGTGAGGGGA